MLKYCPTCNRSSEDVHFIGEFCELCIKEKLAKSLPSGVTLEVCKSCGRIKTREGYFNSNKEAIADAVSSSVGGKWKIAIKEFDWKHATVTFKQEYGDEWVKIDKEIEVKVKKPMCIDCYRQTSGYYEAILQIRGPDSKVESTMAKLMKFISVRNTFTSRVDELENGYDIYLSDKKVANAFFEYYELKPGRSYSLYGLKNGKELYRNIYILRLE
jgi:nonsense-mediated mRNA decay protein 3